MTDTARLDSLDGSIRALCRAAVEARKASYSPYSSFAVGAALLAADGTVFTGCNVENGSFGLTICAERTAVCKAVSSGQKQFQAIAVAAQQADGGFTAPCGACRQFLAEFAPGLRVFVVRAEASEARDEVLVSTLDQMLPHHFRSGFLKK